MAYAVVWEIVIIRHMAYTVGKELMHINHYDTLTLFISMQYTSLYQICLNNAFTSPLKVIEYMYVSSLNLSFLCT